MLTCFSIQGGCAPPLGAWTLNKFRVTAQAIQTHRDKLQGLAAAGVKTAAPLARRGSSLRCDDGI
jgi:hypothetical protein